MRKSLGKAAAIGTLSAMALVCFFSFVESLLTVTTLATPTPASEKTRAMTERTVATEGRLSII